MARLSRFVSHVFRRNRRGQSLVEFTMMLPILLILISGVIEIGFMLSAYLDLSDIARDVARNAADDDPVHDRIGYFNDFPEEDPEPRGFYYRAWVAMSNLFMGTGGHMISHANADDMVVSVFRIVDSANVTRHPAAYTSGDPALTPDCVGRAQGGELGWRLYCNQQSAFTTSEVKAMLEAGAPRSGYVLVELYYNYHMILGLPWIKLFVPDPVLLHVYTLMPCQRASP
jgi:hypothetical protein